jgi:hypothetical protein
MSRTHETPAKPGSTRGRIKTYRVSLRVEQTIDAEDEEEALAIFWDDLMRSQAEEENATVEEM